MFFRQFHFVVAICITAVFVLLSGCREIPADPEGTFGKAKETGLYVGFSHNPPWVIDYDSLAGGVEGLLIKDFAHSNGMVINWRKGSEQKLMKMLENNELHIVIAGITKDNPWKSKKIGLTMPYHKEQKEKHVIALIQGENRLVMNLEKFLYSYKDSINTLINAAEQEF